MTKPEAMSGWDRRRSILVSGYEKIALELFAERGYRSVTVDDIAAQAGVSTRTLFRYFRTKEDCLLGLPRRGMAAEVAMIEALEPSEAPLDAVWEAVRGFFGARPPDTDMSELWEAAAKEAPEVVARVRGEHMHALNEAVVAYCERSLGVRAATDPRPRLIAGVLMGIEFALVETAAHAPAGIDEILESAAAAVDALGERTATKT